MFRQVRSWGPNFLIYYIFLNAIFYFSERSFLSNYADDNVLYAFGSRVEKIKENLNQDL